METRKIGSLDVTLAGLGCNNFGWRIDAAATKQVVDAALDAGINFFDTANVYGGGQSEEFLGAALKGKRDKAVIATKFGMEMPDGGKGAKPAYIKTAVEASLKRLDIDVIDLYQLHRPDEDTPIADTLGALDELVKEGKVREIGGSNFSAAQVEEAEKAVQQGAARFVSLQNHYSLFHREPEKDVLPTCAAHGIGFLPYFPLANGLLTGKYRKGKPFPESSRAADGWGPKMFTEANLDKVEALIQLAEGAGHTLLELAFSWLATRPEVSSVIAGAKTAEQVKANAKAVDWKLTKDQLAEIDRVMAG